jgi:hypothetical protein
MGRPPVGKKAMNPAERQRRRKRRLGILSETDHAAIREIELLGIANQALARSIAAVDAEIALLLTLAKAHPRHKRLEAVIRQIDAALARIRSITKP